eukprot:10918162-Alexandrium_andersonii.AAC.1
MLSITNLGIDWMHTLSQGIFQSTLAVLVWEVPGPLWWTLAWHGRGPSCSTGTWQSNAKAGSTR